MDIVEKLRRIADSCSPFPPPTDMMFAAADEIERLREALKTFADNVKQTNADIDKNWAETVYPLKAENERLRQQNAELVRAFDKVKTITDVHDDTQVLAALNKIAQAAIAKATGGEL